MLISFHGLLKSSLASGMLKSTGKKLQRVGLRFRSSLTLALLLKSC